MNNQDETLIPLRADLPFYALCAEIVRHMVESKTNTCAFELPGQVDGRAVYLSFDVRLEWVQ